MERSRPRLRRYFSLRREAHRQDCWCSTRSLELFKLCIKPNLIPTYPPPKPNVERAFPSKLMVSESGTCEFHGTLGLRPTYSPTTHADDHRHFWPGNQDPLGAQAALIPHHVRDRMGCRLPAFAGRARRRVPLGRGKEHGKHWPGHHFCLGWSS